MMPTTHGKQASTMNRDSQAYWNSRAATFTRNATSDYERWLLDLLALETGEEILDMGCATGTLAVPLARAGHRVHGCDFAEAMLAILDERTAAENLPITSHLLAWEDDWEEAGLGQNSVDVAFASRSLMSGDVPACVRKLDAAARSRAAVVVPDSLLPSRDPRTHIPGADPGFRDHTHLPPNAFFFLRRGPRGPSSPGRPGAIHRARAATFRRVRGPACRSRGRSYRLERGRGTLGPGLPSARHLGVYRLAHRRKRMGVDSPGLVLLSPRPGSACAP